MTDKKQKTFLNNMGVEQLISMFDLLPDIIFWIKDKEHRFIYANQSFILNAGLKNLEQMVGKTDYDISPVHIARQFFSDDNKIINGQHVTERLEINMTQTGDSAWFSTSKRPIVNEFNEIIGSYGITRHLQKQAQVISGVDAIKVPVDFIREHYQEDFTIDDLAKVAHLSVSALERRFRKYLSKTPKQFINEVRLENAQKLLVETNIPISQVCVEVGFSDHSYFSKQFRSFFDELPSDFRNNHQRSCLIDAVL